MSALPPRAPRPSGGSEAGDGGDSGGGSAAPNKARTLSPAELSSKVLDYEAFANDVLRAKLEALGARRAQYEAEREELAELQRTVKNMAQEGRRELKALVDLGAGVHCAAHVPDATRVYVSVGLGFHVECGLAEAAAVAEARREALQAKVNECIDEAATVRAHIRFVMQAIAELQQLGRRTVH